MIANLVSSLITHFLLYSIFISYLFATGNNRLMRELYELEMPKSSRFSPGLWRYRVSVSIDHLVRTMEQNLDSGDPHQCVLLREFLNEVEDIAIIQIILSNNNSHLIYRKKNCARCSTFRTSSSCNVCCCADMTKGSHKKKLSQLA